MSLLDDDREEEERLMTAWFGEGFPFGLFVVGILVFGGFFLLEHHRGFDGAYGRFIYSNGRHVRGGLWTFLGVLTLVIYVIYRIVAAFFATPGPQHRLSDEEFRRQMDNRGSGL